MSAKKSPATATAEDIVDLVEYSINEVKPQIKTRRGANGSIEIEVSRKKFIVSVAEGEFARKVKTINEE